MQMQEQSKNTDYPKKADGSPDWRKFKDGDHGKVWDARRKAYKEYEEEQKKQGKK